MSLREHLIDDWRTAHRLYSVRAMAAIVIVSVAECLVSIYQPHTPVEAVACGLLTAVLGIVGIVLRVTKQAPHG
jgi:uncharacterized membrane protein YbaN (DUF454 family)